MTIKYRLEKKGYVPTKAKLNDAGWDIYASEKVEIPARSRAIVHTGLHVAIPDGYYGQLQSRSGLSCKHSIETGAGVIDSGYRGEICVNLYNYSRRPYTVEEGDRISQMIILPVPDVEFSEGDLDETERGESGFGSTGV